MGITGLWDVIGDGEIVHIAEYAARHYKQHNRPLRIAVDEACWRFTNLTPEQVQKIRDGEPAANPVEKTILWRILRLMKLNIQLLFVYDGPKKPWKRNKRGGALADRELTKLLHQLFDHLKVPYHQAPGEAEAECAALQRRGIVDAVWADDGDTLMFGCQELVKQHKVEGQRIKDFVKVYRADQILQKFDFDRDSFALFAMLTGGDYNPQGLKGCGPQMAKKVSRTEYGVAGKARDVQKNTLPVWMETLQMTLRLCGSNLKVPLDFPDFKAMDHYLNPSISTPEQLDSLRGLRQGWDRKIDQSKLRVLLRQRFNMWTRGFIRHIAPIHLTRALAGATQERKAENIQYGIQLKRTRKPKDGDQTPGRSEVKITFSPLPALEIDLSHQPQEEDWSIWTEKDGTPYDPLQNVETEVLQCFLDNGLPEGGVAPPPQPACRKRKPNAHQEGNPESKTARLNEDAAGMDCLPSQSARKPNGHPQANEDSVGSMPGKRPRKQSKKKLQKNEGAKSFEMPPSPPREPFRLPRSSTRNALPPSAPRTTTTTTVQPKPTVLELGSNSCESDEDQAGSQEYSRPSQSTGRSRRMSPSPLLQHKARPADLVPGESISAAALRELRASSSLLTRPLRPPNSEVSSEAHTGTDRASNPAAGKVRAPPEVIDLT